MPNIKYGQLGTGHAHASKFQRYQESDLYDVVGIVEPNLELRKKAIASGQYTNAKWITREELFNTPELKIVGVETEVSELLTTAEICLNQGYHIHLDKPAGASLPHFKKLLDIAASKHLIIQLGYMYRYSPAFMMLDQFLKNGWLGDVFEIHTVMSKVVNDQSRISLSQYQGGLMFELGCHLIDRVIGILGKPEKVTPYLQHASKKHDDHLLDNTLSVLEFPNAIATVKSSGMEVDGFERRHFVVCGTKGTFHIQPLDDPSVRFTLNAPQGKYKKGYQEIKFGGYTRYIKDLEDLASWIHGKTDPEYTYDHDYLVQKTILQASGMSID
jgi:predicted dehydrogenase